MDLNVDESDATMQNRLVIYRKAEPRRSSPALKRRFPKEDQKDDP